jgi:hypothetical protein
MKRRSGDVFAGNDEERILEENEQPRPTRGVGPGAQEARQRAMHEAHYGAEELESIGRAGPGLGDSDDGGEDSIDAFLRETQPRTRRKPKRPGKPAGPPPPKPSGSPDMDDVRDALPTQPPAPGGNDADYVAVPDSNFKLEKLVGFQPGGPSKMDILTGAMLQRDERECAHLAQALENAKLGASALPGHAAIGDQQFDNALVQDNNCALCRLVKADFNKSADVKNAYERMTLYDLKHCGTKSELALFQECANVFNRLQARAAANGMPAFMIDTPTVAEHLTNISHTFINPKRPIYRAGLDVQNMRAKCAPHLEGTTCEGKHYFNERIGKFMVHLNDKEIEYSAKMMQATIFVNLHFFGQATSELVADPVAKKASRHFAARPMTGLFKNVTMQ